LASSTVLAQTVPDPDPYNRTTVGEGTPREQLPPPRSSHDPQPPVPAPTVPETGVTKQAGVGGTQAYARAGVLELGGSGGFAAAVGRDLPRRSLGRPDPVVHRGVRDGRCDPDAGRDVAGRADLLRCEHRLYGDVVSAHPRGRVRKPVQSWTGFLFFGRLNRWP